MNPLISVIVPVYKVENFLKKCIESILYQTYENLEIILVDDSSPDNSIAICKEYAKKDARIVIIRKENGGVSSARNAGLERATGEFITFVDSDDWIKPEMIKYLYEKTNSNNSNIVSCGVITENIEGKFMKKSRKFEEINVTVEDGLNFYKPYFRNEIYGKLYSSEIINNKESKIRFDEDIFIGEDLLFFCKCALKSNMITYTSKCFYHYIHRDEGAMRSSVTEKKLTDLIARERIISLLLKYPKTQKKARLKKVEISQQLLLEVLKSNYRNPKIKEKLVNNIKNNSYEFLLSTSPKIIQKFYTILVLLNPNCLYYTWRMKKVILLYFKK